MTNRQFLSHRSNTYWVFQLFTFTLLFIFAVACNAAADNSKKPVLIGLDAEFGHQTSTSAEAIKRGMQIAIDEINRSGGVLGGRPLRLEIRDNRSVPARGVANVKELAALPDLVAVFVGKFSPVAQEAIPVVHEHKLPMLDPWAAADNLVDNGYNPNYVFRLSLRDQWAVQTIFNHAKKKKFTRIGLILPNTGWGRSALKAAEDYTKENSRFQISKPLWYNWGDNSLETQYQEIRAFKADAVFFVGNEREGSILIKEIAALPKSERLPIFSHWGITGGDFSRLVGPAISEVDLAVIQTYSFIGANDAIAQRVIKSYVEQYNVKSERDIESPVGVAHAYDLVNILSLAIKQANSTDRVAIRNELEKIPTYTGLFGQMNPPFSPVRHEALNPSIPFMAKYALDGAVERIP